MPHHLRSGDILADRRFAYAAALARDGDHAGAADLLRQVVDIAPGWAGGWVALGEAAERTGDRSAALDAYRRAERCREGEALGAGLHRARLEDRRAVAELPATYVAALFDDYAPRFEAHLTEALGYRGPAALLDALARCGAPARFGQALDLGCGTGLMGRAIRARAAWLAGVDLSAAMVRAAEATGVYDALAVQSAAEALAAAPERLDLVLAADVFAYLGDLRPVLAAASRALAPGGWVAFTVQRSDTDPVRLGDDLRVAHSSAHVGAALEEAGLLTLRLDAASIRRERGIDVPGLVAVARKP